MPKILVLDGLSEEGVNVFQQAKGFEVDVGPSQQPDELAGVIGDYHGLVVRSATKVTGEALRNAKKLRVIGRAGVGTDNIDKATATEMGIVVMNTPGGNTISTCEHTFALLFALCRNVPRAHASMEAGRWDRKKFMGTEVCGKTLGVIGIGRIGSAVAKRAQAFEMNVIVFDPILTKLKAEALGVELVTLDELLERSDFITVHAPKSEKTANMIAMPQLNRMKPTARIINTARGGLVNEADLAQALKENLIAGAALDVYTAEPFEDNPFLGLENVVTTPHLAASTDEAQLSVAVEIAKQMVDYLTAGTIVNAVNVPSLDGATRKQLEPILYLAERLGRFQGLYMEGHPSSIRIEYAGDFGVADMYPVTTAILKGFLEPLVETVNEVSAPSLLEAHGIECSEKRRAAVLDYAFSIGVNVATDKESHHIVGTLFGKGDARICSIDGIRVDAKPEGCMLVCNNEDKPMIMAGITQLLGEAGINIANMTLGRTEPGGLALTVLNLDARPGEDLLDKVRQVPHVTQARLVAL